MPPTSTKISNNPLVLAAGAVGAAMAGLWLRQRSSRLRIGLVRPQTGEARGCALITGASSGLGETFARQLAAFGYDLILVARREDRLGEIANQLTNNYPVQISVFPTDLTDNVQLDHLEQLIAGQPPLALLINNAGFGTQGRLARIDIQKQIQMIWLHVLAPLRLTKAALPGMLSQRKGGIINVSSVAAYLPMPGNVSYGATKSYLNAFSESLQTELAGTGVYVQALCPGFFYSEFHDTDEYQYFRRDSYPKFMWKSAAEVASVSLHHLGDGQVIVIPGAPYKAIAFLAANPLTRPILKASVQRLYRSRRQASRSTRSAPG